jgi:hypothetical protein
MGWWRVNGNVYHLACNNNILYNVLTFKPFKLFYPDFRFNNNFLEKNSHLFNTYKQNKLTTFNPIKSYWLPISDALYIEYNYII